MKKLLTILDVYLTATIPYVLIITLVLICVKALAHVSYSWLAALSLIFITSFLVGVVNSLLFILDRLDKGDKDENHS